MISNTVSRMFTFAALFASTALVAHADEKVLNATLQQAGTIHAAADPAFYDNTTNFLGQAYVNGGAATTAGNTITTLVADDIQLAGSQPVSITGFSFSVANLNTATVSARPRVRFYLADAAGSKPGTELSAFTFNPIAFTSGVAVFNAGISTSPFTVPANSLFWAGITFDDGVGTTGATLAQLNNLGQGIFNPPTIGASQDVFFQTATAGSFNQNTPPGGLFNLGGNPVGNFGWRFNGTAITPEPGAVAMLMGFGVSGAALLRRRRTARK